jgi:antitoxin (DNA-binding transcriptional repressor) of toxin-antitoxin stability system
MKCTVSEAGQELSRLITRACAGEEVVIAAGNDLQVKLVPCPKPEATEDRVPGLLKGKIVCAPNAFDPLTDQELSDLGFE